MEKVWPDPSRLDHGRKSRTSHQHTELIDETPESRGELLRCTARNRNVSRLKTTTEISRTSRSFILPFPGVLTASLSGPSMTRHSLREHACRKTPSWRFFCIRSDDELAVGLRRYGRNIAHQNRRRSRSTQQHDRRLCAMEHLDSHALRNDPCPGPGRMRSRGWSVYTQRSHCQRRCL
jgi:hypothetical protein